MNSVNGFSRLSEYAGRARFHLEARWNQLKERFSSERGAIAIEYILIIGLIAVIIIAVFAYMLWPAISDAMEALIAKISNAIGGQGIEAP